MYAIYYNGRLQFEYKDSNIYFEKDLLLYENDIESGETESILKELFVRYWKLIESANKHVECKLSITAKFLNRILET